MTKRVFITRPILSDGPDLLRAQGLLVEMSTLNQAMTYEALLDKAQHFDALITTLSDRIDQNFLEKNPQLKVISNYAVGFNNIDVAAASARKISIGNTPGVLTEATAEIALGLMICAARGFHGAQKEAYEGKWVDWNPTGHLGHGLYGKTLGIVGLGRIGLRLAEMACQAFKMKIVYVSTSGDKENSLNAKRVTLPELLAQSDFISIHTPLTAATRHLISKKEFESMQKHAVLINTARGEIVDQEALIHALKKHQIFAAGIDVTDPEPLPLESELFKLKNVFILPHIGSATFEARRAMSVMAAENIMAGLEGRALVGWVNQKDLLP